MDFFRKASSLLFEMEPKDETETPASASKDDPLTRVERQALDVDKLLQEQGLGTQKTATSSTQSAAARGATPTNTTASAATNATANATTKTAAQIAQDSAGPNLADVKVEAQVGAAPLQPTAIYAAAKLPATPFSAEQMLEMMASLPAELPLETKRQTVKITLGALGKTLGASPETIVADASRKMAALKSYVEHLQKRTDEYSKNGETEIAALQKQIEAKRKAIDDAKTSLTTATQSCVTEAHRLDDVLEFFSLDVAPSKYAPRPSNEP